MNGRVRKNENDILKIKTVWSVFMIAVTGATAWLR
jgi:hypothetical protein